MQLPNLYKFKINKRIGQRFAYTLYDAVDQTNGKEVRLKVLKKHLAEDQNHVLSFLTAARMLKLLNSPNVCEISDFGNDQDYIYVSSEVLTDWEPMSTLVSETFFLSVQEFLDLFIRVGKTLRKAHLSGITHGLLNPKNIFMNTEGQIKIDDFGYSWAVQEVFRESNKHSIYMSQYISPDLYDSSAKIDGRVDMYSMGAIMFHLLTGRAPYTGRSVSDLQAHHVKGDLETDRLFDLDLPQSLQNAVVRAVDLKSDNRFLNLKEFVGYLEDLREEIASDSATEEVNNTPKLVEESAPIYSEKFFVEEDFDAQKKSIVKAKPFVFALATIVIALSVFLFGKDRISLAFLDDLTAPSPEAASTSESNGTTQVASLIEKADSDINQEAWISAIEQEVEALTQNKSLLAEDSPTRDSFGPDQIQPTPPVVKKQPVTPKKSDKRQKAKTSATSKNKTHTSKAAKTKSRSTDKKVVSKKHAARQADVAKRSESKKPVVRKKSTARTTPVRLVVKSDQDPAGAAVFVNNKFHGKTDRKGELRIASLEVGENYTVKVSKNGFKTVSQNFKASAKRPELSLDLKPKRDIFGTLVLDASPGADSVYVDGKLYRGKMPLNLTLPWGEHRVRYVNSNLQKSWEHVVHLKVGQVMRVKHDFAQAELGKVAVALKNAANYGFGYVYVNGKLWHGTPNTTPLELELPVGSHTIEVRRDGFSTVPKDIIVVVEKNETKFVSFSFAKDESQKTD